jgi:HD-like signal output (HDOD) protein
MALRDVLANEQLKRLASRISCLPSLPALHVKLTEELRLDEPSLDRVGQIISEDLGMTTKILQMVNSAFFRLPQPVSDARQAAAYLGLANLRSLVLSLQVFSQFDQHSVQQFSIEDLAQHCRTTGLRARRIAELEHSDQKVEEQYFLAGLLHDVGKLILAAGLPEQYTRLLERARQTGQPVRELEALEFGATHAEVGAFLLGLWGLPNPVVEAVALHHRPAASSAHGVSAVIAVHVADALTQERTGVEGVQSDNCMDGACLGALGLEQRVEAWKAECLAEQLLAAI